MAVVTSGSQTGERSEATTAWATRGAASTAFPLATEAALEILQAGGNAVDAAVAAAWALSVCEPSGSGLGGQTVLLAYWADGTARVVDGHSYAPAAASLATISGAEQRSGHRSCTIPSTAATLSYAQRKYGVLPCARALAPAIRIAQDGYPITRFQHRQTRWVVDYLRASRAASALFLRDGDPPPLGARFRQPELAATLCRLADDGAEDFYRGGIARRIVEDMQRHGGLVTAADLAECALPIDCEPISTDYRGYRILSVPPPAGGLQLLLAFKVLQQLASSDSGAPEEEWRDAIASAVYAVFRERERRPVGPAGLTPAGRRWYLSEEHARGIAAEIRDHPPLDSRGRNEMGDEEPGDTTHLSVSDRWGNVALLTQSIQSVFGAKVANPALGFLYNNYLRTCRRYPHPYELRGRCRPCSNAAPTLVLGSGAGGGGPWLALGAAGSRRIVSSILQVVSGVVDRGLNVVEAVAAPRLHTLLSGRVWIERPAASEAVLARLRTRFPAVVVKSRHHYTLGSVHALQLSSDGAVLGAADPRRDGTAAVIAEE